MAKRKKLTAKQKAARRRKYQRQYRKEKKAYEEYRKRIGELGKGGSLYDAMDWKSFRHEMRNLQAMHRMVNRTYQQRAQWFARNSFVLSLDQLKILALRMSGKGGDAEDQESLKALFRDPDVMEKVGPLLAQLRTMPREELNKYIHAYLHQFGNEWLEYEGTML